MMFEWHFEGRSTLPFEHTCIRIQIRANAQKIHILQFHISLRNQRKMNICLLDITTSMATNETCYCSNILLKNHFISRNGVISLSVEIYCPFLFIYP